MRLDKPDPPVVVKVTHTSIQLDWSHVTAKQPGQKFTYSIQELATNSNKKEWGVVYS